MIERYTRKELKNIWDENNKFSIWLDIELLQLKQWKNIKLFLKVYLKKLNQKQK